MPKEKESEQLGHQDARPGAPGEGGWGRAVSGPRAVILCWHFAPLSPVCCWEGGAQWREQGACHGGAGCRALACDLAR